MEDLNGHDRPASGPYKNFFDSEKHSDVTIKFGTKMVKAHKVILRSRSEYFDKMLGGNFAETGVNEIELKGDNGLGVMNMLSFIYDRAWSDGTATTTPLRTWWKLENHAHVYVTAQKYGMTDLVWQTWKFIEILLNDDVDAIREPIDTKEVLHILWLNVSPNNTVVRPALAQYCALHFDKFMKDVDFVELMNTMPGLETAVGIALNSINKKGKDSWELMYDE